LKSGEFCKIPPDAIVILKLTQEAEESISSWFRCQAGVTVENGSFSRHPGLRMTGWRWRRLSFMPCCEIS